jgi:hypothetical protein
MQVNQPGHKADHIHTSSAKFKGVWRYTVTPLYSFMVWRLISHSDTYSYIIQSPYSCQSVKITVFQSVMPHSVVDGCPQDRSRMFCQNAGTHLIMYAMQSLPYLSDFQYHLQ